MQLPEDIARFKKYQELLNNGQPSGLFDGHRFTRNPGDNSVDIFEDDWTERLEAAANGGIKISGRNNEGFSREDTYDSGGFLIRESTTRKKDDSLEKELRTYKNGKRVHEKTEEHIQGDNNYSRNKTVETDYDEEGRVRKIKTDTDRNTSYNSDENHIEKIYAENGTSRQTEKGFERSVSGFITSWDNEKKFDAKDNEIYSKESYTTKYGTRTNEKEIHTDGSYRTKNTDISQDGTYEEELNYDSKGNIVGGTKTIRGAAGVSFEVWRDGGWVDPNAPPKAPADQAAFKAEPFARDAAYGDKGGIRISEWNYVSASALTTSDIAKTAFDGARAATLADLFGQKTAGLGTEKTLPVSDAEAAVAAAPGAKMNPSV